MQPFINLCTKNPAFAISAMILGGGIVLFIQAMIIIAKQCKYNVKASGHLLSGIFDGLMGREYKPEPERFITVNRSKDRNVDFYVRTNKGVIPITVSHDSSKVMINPWCLPVYQGESRTAIVYYRDGLNDFAAIEEAVKKILK
jgi:hypothetical protein